MGSVIPFRDQRNKQREWSKERLGKAVAVLVGLCIGGTLAMPGSPVRASSRGGLTSSIFSAEFAECGSVRINCVIDGDTFYQNGRKIRIADINTPETHSPRCEHEEALGRKARTRLIVLLNEGEFELKGLPTSDSDAYGHDLRLVIRDGRSIGGVLVEEGLARPWTGRRMAWCD